MNISLNENIGEDISSFIKEVIENYFSSSDEVIIDKCSLDRLLLKVDGQNFSIRIDKIIHEEWDDKIDFIEYSILRDNVEFIIDDTYFVL